MQKIGAMPDSNLPQPGEVLARYISRPDFCRQVSITINTAEKWASARKGPRVTIIARRAYYHIEDVQSWIDAQRPVQTATQPRRRVLR